ncbi:MAG TPA: dephospho-CoA kinase [Bauldia sp.]|nr:dephospho-CoA kinase [Bauldia sp.]
MLVLAVTGSLAMGKSTVTAMFAEAGAATYGADAAVHRLYSGAAAGPIATAFPGIVKDGIVDRAALGARVADDPAALARLETIVHPLVRNAEDEFRAKAAASGRRLAVLDIPLLFETGAERRVDAVVVVSCSPEIQRGRIAHRAREAGGMKEERAAALIARQMSDADKRARAHFIVDTSRSLDVTRRGVGDILRALAGRIAG